MPFQIQVDEKIMRINLTGYVTKAEMMNLAGETVRLEEGLKKSFDRLVDLSAIEKSDSEYETISSLAKERQAQVIPHKYRCAIVAPNPLDFGCARIFQTLSENPQVNRQVFKTRDEAEKWLAAGE